MSDPAGTAGALREVLNWSGRRAVGNWLVHCADPLCRQSPPLGRALSPSQARQLVAQAEMHGVLPAVLRNFPPFQGEAAFGDVKAYALARQRPLLAYSLMLRAQLEALLPAIAGLPVIVVKGPIFARRLYPAPYLRTFTDIDLLVAPEAQRQVGQVLDAQGFRLAGAHDNAQRQEWKWVCRDNDALTIEVHTNLAHHPQLRAAISLTYRDLAEIAETPAALLTVGVVHGALDCFERLRHVVDICQAARILVTAEQERCFEILVERTGARLAAITALDLAFGLFAEPRCRELARELGPARYRTVARLLLGRSVFVSAMTSVRALHSWRRQAFRLLLKRRRLGGAIAN
jgi:putative nucleotidyltransferase-like protein